MKSYMKIAVLSAMAALSTTSVATELNVEVADLSDVSYNVEVNDIAMPVKGLDLDVEVTSADKVETVTGLDYAVDLSGEDGVKPFNLDLGVEIASGNKDITFEADTSKVYGDFKPFAKLDYTLVDSGKNNGDYTVGTDYTGVTDLTLSAQYNGQYTGADVNEIEVSAAYKFDDRLTGEVTHTMDRDSSTESTELVGKYAFNDSLYTAATYTFEEADDTFGVEVGYKF